MKMMRNVPTRAIILPMIVIVTIFTGTPTLGNPVKGVGVAVLSGFEAPTLPLFIGTGVEEGFAAASSTGVADGTGPPRPTCEDGGVVGVSVWVVGTTVGDVEGARARRVSLGIGVLCASAGACVTVAAGGASVGEASVTGAVVASGSGAEVAAGSWVGGCGSAVGCSPAKSPSEALCRRSCCCFTINTRLKRLMMRIKPTKKDFQFFDIYTPISTIYHFVLILQT
jgi:hypothetical protein